MYQHSFGHICASIRLYFRQTRYTGTLSSITLITFLEKFKLKSRNTYPNPRAEGYGMHFYYFSYFITCFCQISFWTHPSENVLKILTRRNCQAREPISNTDEHSRERGKGKAAYDFALTPITRLNLLKVFPSFRKQIRIVIRWDSVGCQIERSRDGSGYGR